MLSIHFILLEEIFCYFIIQTMMQITFTVTSGSVPVLIGVDYIQITETPPGTCILVKTDLLLKSLDW